MFFKLEKSALFIAFAFSISYTPNCTVSSYNFGNFSGEGLTEPPPQTPPPASSRASPSVRASPSIFGRFAPSTRASSLEFAPPTRQPGSALSWAPLAFLSDCAPVYDAALWYKYSQQSILHLKQAIINALKWFCGFKKYSRVTNILLQLGLPSFDTIMHNPLTPVSISKQLEMIGRSAYILACLIATALHLDQRCSHWKISIKTSKQPYIICNHLKINCNDINLFINLCVFLSYVLKWPWHWC